MTRHGTNPGWVEHVRQRSRPCPKCERAREEYLRRCQEGGPALQSDRAASRAQARAAVELRRRHPDEWTQLYQWAKALGEVVDTRYRDWPVNPVDYPPNPPLDKPASV